MNLRYAFPVLLAIFGIVPAALAQQQTEQIDRLLAMSGEDRRAALRAMPADERNGLWFALKREQAARRGATAEAGFYRAALPANSKSNEPEEAMNRHGGKAVGSIVYDDGVSTNSFGGGQLVGNRFNTHTGIPVFASGQVNTIQAVVVPGASITTSSAGFVMLGPQTTGGGALALFSSFTTASGATDTVTFSGLGVDYTGSSFYVLFGDFSSSYVPAFGTGTSNGQGHHGVVGYTGGMGPNITGTFNLGGTLNGLVRATGNIVPVELMNFAVD